MTAPKRMAFQVAPKGLYRTVVLIGLMLASCSAPPPPFPLNGLVEKPERSCNEVFGVSGVNSYKEYRCTDGSVFQIVGSSPVILKEFEPIQPERKSSQ